MTDGLLALALGAGMVAAINPCGFALLPAYLSLLVLGDSTGSRRSAVGRALALTGAMTLGFVAVFGIFGLVIAPVAAGVQRYLPWVTVVVGCALLLLGIWLVAGRALPTIGWSPRGPRLTRRFASMAGFGAAYAVASLTCTIAPFLAIVVASFRASSAGAGVALFVAYALGHGPDGRGGVGGRGPGPFLAGQPDAAGRTVGAAGGRGPDGRRRRLRGLLRLVGAAGAGRRVHRRPRGERRRPAAGWAGRRGHRPGAGRAGRSSCSPWWGWPWWFAAAPVGLVGCPALEKSLRAEPGPGTVTA